MTRILNYGRLFYFTLLLLIPLSAAVAASGSGEVTDETTSISPDLIKARIDEVESSTTYSDEDKAGLIEVYRKALGGLEAASSNAAAADSFSKSRETAPAETEAIRKELDKLEKADAPVILKVNDSTPLEEVEQILLTEKANQAAIKAKLSELEEQLANEADRPGEIHKRLDEIKQGNDQANSGKGKDASSDEPAALREARKWVQTAKSNAQTSEVNMLDQELLSQPARIALLKAQIDKTEHAEKRTSTRVQLLEELVNNKRRAEAETVLAESQADVSKLASEHTSPLVTRLANENASLSKQLKKMSTEFENLAKRNESARKRTKAIEDDYRNTQQKLDVAGMNQALGLVLLEHQRDLPNLRSYRKLERQRNRKISESALLQIQLNEEYKRIRDNKVYVDELLSSTPEEETSQVRDDLLDIVDKRQDLIKKAIKQSDAYLRALGELEFVQQQLLRATRTYDAYLAEHLLWIRSAPPPSIAMLTYFPQQVRELLSPRQWLDAIKTLASELSQSISAIIVFMVFAVLTWKSRQMRQALERLGEKTSTPKTDRFIYTLQAIVLTLLLASPWPLLVYLFGIELDTSADASEFSKAIAHGLLILAPIFYYLLAFRRMCIPNGLAHAHFRWPLDSLMALRRQFRRLMFTFLPSAFIAIVVIHHGAASVVNVDGGLGRLAFAVMVISISALFYRLLGPNQQSLQPFMVKYPHSMLARFRYVWLALALALPILLVILAIGGYLYTAGVLTENLIWTLWLTLGYIILQQLIVRWLLMTRRKMAFEAAAEQHREQLDGESNDAGGSSQYQVEEPEIDLRALNDASHKIVNLISAALFISGLWVIWSGELPALGLFDNVTLWHKSITEGGEAQEIAVTLGDLVIAVIAVIITFVAARRFPALLELILLNRPSVSAGGRYATTTLTRYTIVAIGIMFALNTMGASWSKVQWLAAALSVGIGFGLQEIVANFISGIIILFERPIRVGDVVTIGETDGVITRIQIRATTMRTWDRQELLVPNKEFITGRLLNWSLSDQTTRIKIPVGIAYGSDVEQAMKLMSKAAEENEMILHDPAPSIIFEAFGDNSLNLVLRCFVGQQDDRMPARTALHQAINDKFNTAGISISFPQRDVHLDASQPLDIRIQHDNASGN